VPVEADGTLSLDAIEAAIRPDDQHYPRTRLVCLENTHASSGGQPLPLSYVDAVGELCRKHDLALHIDGARIFNAAVPTGVDVARLTQAATSVTFCLSKGLCAPVGSVIVGDEAFIQQARRIRKALGGGMRQAGIVAAAGIVALDEMTSRLAEDHANACRLAKGLSTIPAIDINVGAVKTNILYFNLRDDAPRSPAELAEELKTDDILIKGAYHQRRFRLVTHYWIKSSHVDLVMERMRSLLE
jgi:threonine aldolase